MRVLASAALQHRCLLAWGGSLHRSASVSRGGSQFVCYHVTASLLRPEDSGVKPVVRTRQRHKQVQSDTWRDNERSVRSKVWKKEEVPLVQQRTNQRKGDDHRVSSELRKLYLDDFPPERQRLATQRSTLDPKTESHEIVFGIAPCLMALTQGRRKIRKLFVKDGESSSRASVLKVCEEAYRRGVQVQRVGKKDLEKMSSGGVHQGVCLQASPLSYLTEDPDSQQHPAPNRKGTPVWLVLEGIQDPMNLGAILRSAYFLGVDRVASSLRYSCPLSPVVSKASSGAMEVLGVYGYDDLGELLRLKVAQGWQAVGTVGAGGDGSQIPVTQCLDFQITRPTLLLIGGEAEGLSQELLSLCQTLLTIPAGRDLSLGIESLNVSVATGILLHSLLFSRRSTRRRIS